LIWLDAEMRLRQRPEQLSVEILLWIFWKNIDEPVLLEEEDEDEDRQNYDATKNDCRPQFRHPPNAPDARIMGVPVLFRDARERIWFVARMLRVAKLLGQESWEEIRSLLLRTLIVGDGTWGEIGEESHPLKSMGSYSSVTSQFRGGEDHAVMEMPWMDDDKLRKGILGELYFWPPEMENMR